MIRATEAAGLHTPSEPSGSSRSPGVHRSRRSRPAAGSRVRRPASPSAPQQQGQPAALHRPSSGEHEPVQGPGPVLVPAGTGGERGCGRGRGGQGEAGRRAPGDGLSSATGCSASSPGPPGTASRRPTTAEPATAPTAADIRLRQELLAAAWFPVNTSRADSQSTRGSARPQRTCGRWPWKPLPQAARARRRVGRLGSTACPLCRLQRWASGHRQPSPAAGSGGIGWCGRCGWCARPGGARYGPRDP